ncbi:MAG: cytochrome b/b6 domain-containing protein [Gallionella sp.]|nr:cytochrome b/b6 domain-containing protein [Gallionella sp.]
MKQYSKRMVIIHWLTLALLAAAWLLGDVVHDARYDGGATIGGYLAHMLAGAAVLLLTVARLVFRSKDGVPPALGDTPMDKVAKGLQHLLYAVLILLPVSGTMQVLTSDVGKAIAAGDSSLLPAKFTGVTAHIVHEWMVWVLIALVAVHVLGALKHQFVMKDNIMDRMSLRGRK